MKLVKSESPGSFYESFSDLIFSTLIIFIVLVMGLAMQMNSATDEAKDAAAKSAEEVKKSLAEIEKARAEAERLRNDAERIRAETEKAKSEAEKAKSEAEKAKSETAGLRQAISRLVATNRFTGGADETTFYFTPLDVGGKTHIVWLPIRLMDVFRLNRVADRWDPVLMICRMALQAAPDTDGPLIMSADDVVGLAGGVSHAFVDSAAISDNGWHFAIVEGVRKLDPAAFARMTPQQLRDRIGGTNLRMDEKMSMVPADLRPAVLEWFRWSRGPENTMVYRWKETIEPLAKAVEAIKGQPPYVRFTTTADRKIRIGRTVLTQAQFRNLLRAIKPGRGFYIEYLTPEGKAEEPPEWVFREILDVVGFNNHIVNDAAVRERPK